VQYRRSTAFRTAWWRRRRSCARISCTPRGRKKGAKSRMKRHLAKNKNIKLQYDISKSQKSVSCIIFYALSLSLTHSLPPPPPPLFSLALSLSLSLSHTHTHTPISRGGHAGEYFRLNVDVAYTNSQKSAIYYIFKLTVRDF
jgi:hypothetical protein